MNLNNENLLESARRASERAYCPYSHYPVGAAVLTASGQVFEGCNIENASYGLSICAERVAVFKAIAAAETQIVKIAVCCAQGNTCEPSTLMPCGACRQVLREFLDPETEVIVDGVGVFRLDELLPRPFSLNLQRHSKILSDLE